MLNREQTWDTFFGEVNKHCDNRDNGDRSLHRFLVYALAPGTGKTTMLVTSGEEFERRRAAGTLSPNFPSQRLDIFTTFNFTTAAEASDREHPQFALAWRMFDAVFATSTYDGSCDAPLREALRSVLDHEALLRHALLAIRQHRVNIGKCGVDERLAINLCIDEFPKMLAEGLAQAQRQAPLYAMIKALGKLLCAPPEKLLLIVTMAGTTAVDLDQSMLIIFIFFLLLFGIYGLLTICTPLQFFAVRHSRSARSRCLFSLPSKLCPM